MRISIFGNPDYEPDALPLKLLPYLKKRFPNVEFIVTDPNELGIPDEKEWCIIDTVKGLSEIKLLSLEDLKKPRKNRVSMHDFDLAMHLFWLNKIKKDLRVNIIGIPPSLDLDAALEGTIKILANLLPENESRS